MWLQRQLRLDPVPAGFHLVTAQVVAALEELQNVKVGLLHIFIRHTSASLTINENADPAVSADLHMALDRIAPEDLPYDHTCEGPDDMPAHVKASLLGASVSIPVAGGELQLGTWQGIYLCEHRRHGTPRTLILTLQGE